MKRIPKKHPDGILTADWHLREDTPTCRTDDFQKAQEDKVNFIVELAHEYACDIYHAGDLFNHWKPSPYLLTWAVDHLPSELRTFHTIYGNHDLPQHNLDLAYKSGTNTLEAAEKVHMLKGCHWNQIPSEEHWRSPNPLTGKYMLVWHVMNYQGRKPWPGCTDPSSMKLLRQYPQFDLILTGHNHKPFVETNGERVLVNPGSITRQSANETHKPRVYLWFAEENRVQPVYLPIQEDVITREHIEIKEQRDARIDAFISRLDGNWEAEMSFEDNLEAFFQTNNIRQSVKDIIYKALEHEHN